MGEVDVFEAIANPTRRQLLDLLRDGPKAVHELAAVFPMSRPAVSQHLRVLRASALVVEDRVGRERRYRLHALPLRRVEEWLEHYEEFWRGRIAALHELLDEES